MIAQVISCFRLINCVSEIAGLCLTGYFLVVLLLELSVQAESATMDLNVVQIEEYYSGPFGAKHEIQNHSGNIYADFISVHIAAASAASAAPHPKYSKPTETDCSFVSSPSSDGSFLELSDGDTGASSVLSFNSDSKLGSSAGSSMKPAVVVDCTETDEIKRTQGNLFPDNDSIFNGESKISKVETTALLPAANPDIDMESGWQVQGRKRRNSRRRTGTNVDIVSGTSGKKLTNEPEPPVSESPLSKNPFLVLAHIDENDYQGPRPCRPHKKAPGNLELSSLENVSPGITAVMDLAVDNYEALIKNAGMNSMDIACETIDEKDLELSQDLLEGSPPDAEEDPHMGSKQVGTTVEMSDILVSDDGWRTQGRKRRNSRKRPESSLIMATTTGSILTDQKGSLGSTPSMKNPSSNLNPFLVLAEISEEDFQTATPRRYSCLKN